MSGNPNNKGRKKARAATFQRRQEEDREKRERADLYAYLGSLVIGGIALGLGQYGFDNPTAENVWGYTALLMGASFGYVLRYKKIGVKGYFTLLLMMVASVLVPYAGYLVLGALEVL